MNEVLAALESAAAATVVAAPGLGEGFWAGGPSAVPDGGRMWLAYRLRRPVEAGRGYANVVAVSDDGVRFTTVATLTSAQFGCASLERPALVRRPDGGWRLYVSCSTPGSKHWWVEAVDADTVAGLPSGRRTVVLPGDEREAWKDVVVRPVSPANAAGQANGDGRANGDGQAWSMWACRHPLDGGEAAADRMSTWYATSADGLMWTMRSEALAPVPGSWDARGTRIADVVRHGDRWWAVYDGRRSAEENWRERSGLAVGTGPDRFTAVAGPAPDRAGTALRYTCLVETGSGWRAYWEASAADGSHDLRTVYIPRPSGASQSV